MSSTKRKSDAKTTAAAKKARLAHSVAKENIESIVNDPDNFLIPESTKAIQKLLLEVALYARSIEEEIQASKPKVKTKEELKAAAEKLRNAARSGIRKQMTVSCYFTHNHHTRRLTSPSMQWKLSCKTGSAKWVYDGVCADPAIFGAFLGLDGPPTFKTKKIPKGEFQDLVGDLCVSIRYVALDLLSTTETELKLPTSVDMTRFLLPPISIYTGSQQKERSN